MKIWNVFKQKQRGKEGLLYITPNFHNCICTYVYVDFIMSFWGKKTLMVRNVVGRCVDVFLCAVC